jgi:methylthioribose-1-phosphate isomerase
VIRCADAPTAPEGVGVYNPAFDVTNGKDITAIITEKGVIEKPNTERIRALLAPAEDAADDASA